jgi:hypothetical protein
MVTSMKLPAEMIAIDQRVEFLSFHINISSFLYAHTGCGVAIGRRVKEMQLQQLQDVGASDLLRFFLFNPTDTCYMIPSAASKMAFSFTNPSVRILAASS